MNTQEYTEEQTEASKLQMKIKKRFNDNLDFFKTYIPTVYKTIEENKCNTSLLVDAKTSQLFKNVNNTPFYQDSPVKFAQKEVSDFMDTMKTLDYRPRPSSLFITHLLKHRPFSNTLSTYAQAIKNSSNTQPEYKDLVIFGCGLGYHIEMLCNKNKFFHMTIVEKNLSNFIESLYTLNWSSLMANLNKQQTITFILKNDDITKFHQNIQFHLHEQFPAITSSTIIYNHLSMDDYTEEKKIIENLMNYTRVVYEKLGPDTQRMMNANKNISNSINLLNLEKTKITPKKTNIAIVGAGPSFDLYAEELKLIKDKVFIVSCGSSIRSLLKIGIKPDLHFELEFKNLAYELIKHTNEEYDLSDITLLATIEANPKIYNFFKKSYAIAPETTELAEIFNKKAILSKGGLTCTNGAAAFIDRIHEGEIYLFGLDFAHTNGSHHAKENITNQDNLPDELNKLEKSGNKLHSSAVLKVKDVNGNELRTNQNLFAAKLLMETLVKSSKNTFYNCSYGSHIEGSTHISNSELINTFDKLNTTNIDIDYHEIKTDKDLTFRKTKQLFDISYNVSKQLIDLVKEHKDISSPVEFCIKINGIVRSITREAGHYSSQYRSIMSVNRLPLILLFAISNYTEGKYREAAINEWLDDYISYYEYTKDEILGRLDRKDFSVDEDWVDNKI